MTSITLEGDNLHELNAQQARLFALITRIDSWKNSTCNADSGLCEYCSIGYSCSFKDAASALMRELARLGVDIETKEDLFRDAKEAFPQFETDEPIDGADFLQWFSDRMAEH